MENNFINNFYLLANEEIKLELFPTRKFYLENQIYMVQDVGVLIDEEIKDIIWVGQDNVILFDATFYNDEVLKLQKMFLDYVLMYSNHHKDINLCIYKNGGTN